MKCKLKSGLTIVISFLVGFIAGWIIWSGVITWPFGLKCPNGASPDSNGCCSGETYMYIDGAEGACPPNGFCCCPEGNGDCFPPIGK